MELGPVVKGGMSCKDYSWIWLVLASHSSAMEQKNVNSNGYSESVFAAYLYSCRHRRGSLGLQVLIRTAAEVDSRTLPLPHLPKGVMPATLTR
jgi:hypothetical protein